MTYRLQSRASYTAGVAAVKQASWRKRGTARNKKTQRNNRRHWTAVKFLNSLSLGAADGIRTHDPLLGKEMLYH